MSRFSEKGYFVKENTPIYLTLDMDKTAEWIEKMHAYITSKGWNKITSVKTQPWGGKTCSLTTIDGYIIDIFE